MLAGSAGVARAAIAGDEVTSLPGWDKPLPSKMYSGYLTVDEAAGRKLHYWVQYSENDPSTDPVSLWLNGGPGCSSLDGAMYESGQFHVNETDHTKLYYNEYTWSKVATMIYLEAPAGVGFSYAVDPLATTNDTQTAEDNFMALKAFFKGFPELATNDFFIAGESYAGVYVPTLAARVLKGNAAGESNIKLTGIAVGNGCTGTEVGVCSAAGTKIDVDFFHARGLYSDATYNSIQSTCKDLSNPGSACQTLLNDMSTEIGNIDIYDIYAPCINGDGRSSVDANGINQRRGMTPASGHPMVQGVGGPDGCIDAIAAGDWLNTAAVQDALHVSSGKAYWKQWQVCTGSINYQPNTPNEPRDVYPGLVKAGLRIMIFNGDVDGCVPMPDNEAWTSGMGYPVKTGWHAWQVNSQVAGYATEFDAPGGSPFWFVTVHDSGHMVPQYQPQRALAMITNYFKNSPM